MSYSVALCNDYSHPPPEGLPLHGCSYSGADDDGMRSEKKQRRTLNTTAGTNCRDTENTELRNPDAPARLAVTCKNYYGNIASNK